jgi:outer membrane protein assembly factor BamA
MLLIVMMLFPSRCLHGQADTRAEEIQREREQRRTQLKPDRANKAERTEKWIFDKKILGRIHYGISGFRVRMGGMVTGSGFALGPEYYRQDFLSGRMTFKTGAQFSFKGYQKYDMEWNLTRLANQRVFVDFYSAHRNYPRINYYGPGPQSLKGQRSNYRLEDTSTDVALGVQPLRNFKVGGSAGYLWVNVGPGTDSRFISTEKQFTPAQAPGIDRQSNFFRYGAFAQVDYRDDPLGARSGGNYVAQYTWYQDRLLGLHDFRRFEVDLQQYIGLFNKRRVFALRAKTILTDTDAGQTVPFYLQPVLGGSDDLRGFRSFRFSDTNMLVLNGEYRWEAFSGLDMALFVDGGKVFPRRGQLNFRDLEASYGFGLRFNVTNHTFMRIDVGFSREGFQVWVKFSNFIRRQPLGTMGAQPHQ